MTLEFFYGSIGGNYAEVKNRFKVDSLIERFILKYLKDASFNELENAIKCHDIEGSFRAVHTLKGVSGNLSFNKLYLASIALTEQLRPLTCEADVSLYNDVKKAHEEVINALNEFNK